MGQTESMIIHRIIS